MHLGLNNNVVETVSHCGNGVKRGAKATGAAQARRQKGEVGEGRERGAAARQEKRRRLVLKQRGGYDRQLSRRSTVQQKEIS